MTDKDNSQTGEYSYTYSYSYSKEGGEKNVEVHTGGFSAATAGEAAADHQKHHRQDYHTLPQHDHQLPKQHQLPQ